MLSRVSKNFFQKRNVFLETKSVAPHLNESMTSSSASEPETKIKGIIDHLVRTISAAVRRRQIEIRED
jgi:hypothetical protein